MQRPRRCNTARAATLSRRTLSLLRSTANATFATQRGGCDIATHARRNEPLSAYNARPLAPGTTHASCVCLALAECRLG
eukprot:6477780-Lingulodinium_polyedra.AAC.1